MKTKRNYSWTDPKTRMAIIADRSAGLSCTAIAEKYGVDKATVSRVCSKFRQEVPKAELSIDLENWKQQLREKAIAAIDAALDAAFDPYKRGSIAVQVLKGLGDFAAENAVQVNHFDINNIPPDLLDRYIQSPEDEKVVHMIYKDGVLQTPEKDPSPSNLIDLTTENAEEME